MTLDCRLALTIATELGLPAAEARRAHHCSTAFTPPAETLARLLKRLPACSNACPPAQTRGWHVAWMKLASAVILQAELQKVTTSVEDEIKHNCGVLEMKVDSKIDKLDKKIERLMLGGAVATVGASFLFRGN